jgi:hypothetical protein
MITWIMATRLFIAVATFLNVGVLRRERKEANKIKTA